MALHPRVHMAMVGNVAVPSLRGSSGAGAHEPVIVQTWQPGNAGGTR